ncbi:putative DNA topology modulation FlaR protein [Sinorhizobium fredii NGR234]|uniref:DNA topology modulation FlaR protein n=1 Tax=Sinorhizobium fredii (strain NBRC 101917 / NGR234) TaxID=394 RepID=C3MBL0_SINFN|nr:ATPase AAA [Sinorhizobium fredii]ACP25072.1 putative DNA topology modulation FlaR protein [Sinorhizobium fredii NGR234]
MANHLSDMAEAASHLSRAKRILVIGCSGGGKTTLARWLSARFDLPFVSMDQEFFWLPGWVSRARAEQRTLIAARVDEPRWVMDGTNPSSFDLRMPRTDVVVWVRMPRLLCLWGAASRWLKWRGQARPEMADGCPERLSPDFIRYIWTFERKFAPAIAIGLEAYSVPVIQIRSRAQMRRLLDLLAPRP